MILYYEKTKRPRTSFAVFLFFAVLISSHVVTPVHQFDESNQAPHLPQ